MLNQLEIAGACVNHLQSVFSNKFSFGHSKESTVVYIYIKNGISGCVYNCAIISFGIEYCMMSFYNQSPRLNGEMRSIFYYSDPNMLNNIIDNIANIK